MTLLCICAHCALNSKHLIITMIMATFEERCDILWKSSISGKYKQWQVKCCSTVWPKKCVWNPFTWNKSSRESSTSFQSIIEAGYFSVANTPPTWKILAPWRNAIQAFITSRLKKSEIWQVAPVYIKILALI